MNEQHTTRDEMWIEALQTRTHGGREIDVDEPDGDGPHEPGHGDLELAWHDLADVEVTPSVDVEAHFGEPAGVPALVEVHSIAKDRYPKRIVADRKSVERVEDHESAAYRGGRDAEFGRAPSLEAAGFDDTSAQIVRNRADFLDDPRHLAVRMGALHVVVDGEDATDQHPAARAIEPAKRAELKRHHRPFVTGAPNAPDDGPTCINDRLRNERPEPFSNVHLHQHLRLLRQRSA